MVVLLWDLEFFFGGWGILGVNFYEEREGLSRMDKEYIFFIQM